MKSWSCLLLVPLLGCAASPREGSPAAPVAELTLASLLEEMADRAALARLPDPAFSVRQASSYDRGSVDPADPEGWFANRDWSHFVRSQEHEGRTEWVLMDEQGPGAVVRFWVTGPKPLGRLRFYLDGAETPAIDEVLFDLFSGASFVPAPLAMENAPLRTDVVGGLNLYLPVPYAERCVITYDDGSEGPPPSRYFNVEYRTYAPDTAVETFTRAGYDASRRAVERACAALTAPLEPISGDSRTALMDMGEGASFTQRVRFPDGGAIDLIEVRVEGEPAALQRALRSLVLVGTFDGEQTIWCPVGDLFGSGVGLNPVRNALCETEPDKGVLRGAWVMPFQREAELTITNLGPAPVRAQLDVRTREWDWDERSTHFWATWRRQRGIPTRPFQDWNYVAVEGSGRYLGDTLSVFNPERAWWGEGDEKVWVDGAATPSHIGTGTEDHYGYSYCNPVVFQSPWCNQPRVDGPGNAGHTTNHRSRLLDAIPFERGLRFDIEVWSWAETEMTYAVASRFYARPGARTNREPLPDEARVALEQLPGPRRVPGAIEAEGLEVLDRSVRLEAEPQSGAIQSGRWSGDTQLWLRGQGVGDFVELAVPAPDPEARRLFLYATRSWDYGILRFSVNGLRAGPDHDLYCPRVEPAGPFELGVFEPVDGRWVLRAEVVGAHPDARPPQAFFGLDCLVARRPDEARSFAEQAAFLGEHTELVTLSDASGRAVVTVAPEWQGRVMTSTMAGPDGPGCGYVHRERILSGEVQPHMNVFGGEDRIWLGPEAGQFGLYFAPGDPFDLEHWQTPAAIDTEAWEVASQGASEVSLHHRTQLLNHSGTSFDIAMERSVRLLDPAELAAQLGAALPDDLQAVAYESENTITNAGDAPWLEETGLVSIWIMGMFPPGPGVTVVIPVIAGPESELGPPVNDSYFGAIPPEYLQVDAERSLVFLRADGQRRGKIGIPPRRASPVAGSWDPDGGVLTLVGYDKPGGVTRYVNSEWRIQDEPYGGDVVNSYNDGPPAPGVRPLGPFYEIETSSPGAALAPGAALTHVQRTMHLRGERAALDGVARAVLGVSLDEIEAIFPDVW